MRFSFLAIVSGVCLLAVSTAARADVFTITGANTISFDLPASPSPNSSLDTFGFTVNNVDVTFNNAHMTEEVLFFEDGIVIAPNISYVFDPFEDITAPDALVFDFTVTTEAGPFGFPTSLLTYTGGEATPTFTLGTYGLEDAGIGDSDTTLTITADAGTPPVPEPSSFALLGTGVLGLAGMMRKRFA